MPIGLFTLFLVMFSSKVFAYDDYAKDLKPTSCRHGNVIKTGLHESINYILPPYDVDSGCRQRALMNLSELNQDYLHNRKLIEDKIESILNNPACEASRDLVSSYQKILKFTFEQMSKRTKESLTAVKKIIEDLHITDMQMLASHAGAFKKSCELAENRSVILNDVDAINHLKNYITVPEIEVKNNNEEVSECADVIANGSTNLDGFIVSMKKADGQQFLFEYDTYRAPDNIILKNSDGKILYESGCVGSSAGITLDLSELKDEKKMVSVQVKNDCKKLGGSAWTLRFQCKNKPPVSPCNAEIDILIELIRSEINYLKKIMDAEANELYCYRKYYLDISASLTDFPINFMQMDEQKIYFCDYTDDYCLKKMALLNESEKLLENKIPPTNSILDKAVVKNLDSKTKEDEKKAPDEYGRWLREPSS